MAAASQPSSSRELRGESESGPATKGYGKACLNCRQRKRKCKPSTSSDACAHCLKDGTTCQVVSKRPVKKKRRIATVDLLESYAMASSEDRRRIIDDIQGRRETRAETPSDRSGRSTSPATVPDMTTVDPDISFSLPSQSRFDQPHSEAMGPSSVGTSHHVDRSPLELSSREVMRQFASDHNVVSAPPHQPTHHFPYDHTIDPSQLAQGSTPDSPHYSNRPPHYGHPPTSIGLAGQSNIRDDYHMTAVPSFEHISPAHPSVQSNNGLLMLAPTSSFSGAVDRMVHDVCGDMSRHDNMDELLIRTYFSWQCPQLFPVRESLFRRDMASGGPYYSRLLHDTICAQASRHAAPEAEGRSYTDRAAALLVNEILRPPTIPTIQSLLIMAGRRLALGESHTGWLFSGMAIRMLIELGIPADLFKRPEDIPLEKREDLAMRKQLFWSAYCWDKFFALTLGRQPTLHLPETFDGEPFKPDGHRAITWTPVYPEDTSPYYAPQPSLEDETFYASCLLYQTIEKVILRLYCRGKTREETSSHLAFVRQTSTELIQWRHRVSSRVLLDTAYLPVDSPPPHILTINILYRTTWILLHRPSSHNKQSYPPNDALFAQQTCIAKADEIHHLFQLHERSFGLRNITYLVAYMAYVAATIDVVDALSQDPTRSIPASKRLELTLRVLTRAVKHTPGIQRSIHYLRQKLSPGDSSHIVGTDGSANNGGILASGLATPTTAHPASGPITSKQISDALDQPMVRMTDGNRGDMMQTLQAAPVANSNNTNMGNSTNGQQGPTTSLFGGQTLNLGFDELFNSLLPEYSVPDQLSDPLNWPFVMEESTAYLPMGFDWPADMNGS